MLSQMVIGGRAWGIGEILIAVIVIAAAIGVVWVALRQFGVSIPQWAITIFWIIVVAFVAVMAIKLLFSL